MTNGSRLINCLFVAVCFGLSCLMLLMSLGARVRLISIEENISLMEKEAELCRDEINMISIKLENSRSLSELEQLALETLGMHTPRADQIFYLDTVSE